jgi:hypothetical protein
MTAAALQRQNTMAVRPARHVHCVPVQIITLSRIVTTRVAVHASWMMEHGNDRLKGSCGSGIITPVGSISPVTFSSR